MNRWRGLMSLVQDAVEQGATALEALQKQAASRPFELLESVSPLSGLVRGVHQLHDAAVSGTYGMVRLVNRLIGQTVGAALSFFEAAPPRSEP